MHLKVYSKQFRAVSALTIKAGAISALQPLSDKCPDMSCECSKIKLSKLYLELFSQRSLVKGRMVNVPP